ncbi:Type II/IV secretion system protein [uncultured archaeon]|nr:Type II/IV secretion system protein [uncultured archaeon]
MAETKPKAGKQQKEQPASGKIYEEYTLSDGSLSATVKIEKREGDRLPTYILGVPKLEPATEAVLKEIKPELIKKVSISTQEALNLKMAGQLKAKFIEAGKQLVRSNIPHLSAQQVETIARKLVQEMLGLGDIDFLLCDSQIEEICVNSSAQPVWIYHRKYGWIRTSVVIDSESQIWNYSTSIARGVGRQITVKTPLLDAYLSTGDRVNATISPISYNGNTITIRKFARKPWSITDYIRTKTISSDVAALLWLAIQYEANMIVSGGTGAGKTSLLNVLSMFIPENQRVISIEQTREITLPSHLQWVPLVVREPTSEGMGSITMLDLMVNSLRMRPDRIIVGEIRRAEEAEVLFEAMHTGHSVMATMHAETVSETVNRLLNPPISIQPLTLKSLNLVVAMFRDRRQNIRRVFELGEIVPSDKGVSQNILYAWKPSDDSIVSVSQSTRLMHTIKTYTSMSDADIRRNLEGKKAVLDWLLKNDINGVEEVGRIISEYYSDPDALLAKVHKK